MGAGGQKWGALGESRGPKAARGALRADPCRSEPRPHPARRRARPRGGHTELLRFMRPRKVDRLCRPVDTELMAERCVPLHRQRCEGVSL